MRQPTPLAPLYEWHARALRGLAPENDGTPRLGWYQRRLVKGGVFVPARIWLEQEIDAETGELVAPEELRCEVNGRPADPDDAWSWICSDPIPEQQFHYLTARLSYAAAHEPADAFADPRKPVDLLTLPPLF